MERSRFGRWRRALVWPPRTRRLQRYIPFNGCLVDVMGVGMVLSVLEPTKTCISTEKPAEIHSNLSLTDAYPILSPALVEYNLNALLLKRVILYDDACAFRTMTAQARPDG